MIQFIQFIKKMISENRLVGTIAFINKLYYEKKTLTYKAADFASLAQGAYVEDGVRLFYPDRMVIREGAIIHKGTTVNARGGFHLGRYSGISYNCTIMTVDHRILKANSIPFDNRAILKPVYISDFVMIGAHVCITPGVRIGEGAVVGMGSVINRDIKPLSIVMGNPATVIGYRDKTRFDSLKEQGAFQSPIVEKYHDYLPLMSKRKYPDLLKELRIRSDEFPE